MKKSNPKWLMFLTATMILSACSFGDKVLERNDKPLAPAYTSFQEVDENYRSANVEVKLVCESQGYPHPIRVFSSVNEQWIVDADMETNEESQGERIFYKINENGIVIDTLLVNQTEYWPQFMGEFMVFTNYDQAYYTTWPLNGDTTKRNFKILNSELTWETAKLNQTIAAAKANASFWFYKNVTKNEIYYMQFFFYKDKQWQILWLKSPSYQSVNDNEEAARYQKEVLRTGDEDPYLPENVSFLHFHPLEKLNYSHNIGGGNPGFDVTNWRGKAFFKTKIGDKDFNYFVPNIAVEKESFDEYENRFYSVPEPGSSGLNFRSSIFLANDSLAFYSSHRTKLFMIRQRQNK